MLSALLLRSTPMGVGVPLRREASASTHLLLRASSASRRAVGPSKYDCCHLALNRVGRVCAASKNWSSVNFFRRDSACCISSLWWSRTAEAMLFIRVLSLSEDADAFSIGISSVANSLSNPLGTALSETSVQ